jgi:3-oxoacyl-[acyl-carrier protein] reductase
LSGLIDTVALVTGGARGIGKAIVRALSDAGATVAFTYRSSEAAAEEMVREIAAQGRTVIGYRSDASSARDAARVVEAVLEECGRLDILVNNAGVTRDGFLMRMSEEDWDSVITNNLKSVYNFTRACCRPMLGQRSGKIINITSVVGIAGNAGQANYAASKAGIIGFTKSVAKELASRNIQVNAVAPSFVDTDMTSGLSKEQNQVALSYGGKRGIARPEQVAGIVAFLASESSDVITGQTFIAEAAERQPVQLPR